MSFSLHTVDIDVDFEHIQSGSVLNSISDFIDNTFDNRGNIQSVGHDDMHINGQFAAVLANPNSFVRRVFFCSAESGTLGMA